MAIENPFNPAPSNQPERPNGRPPFREIFFNRIFTLRNLFFIANFLVLFLFMYSLISDTLREWKPYQKEYKKQEIRRIRSEMEKGSEETKKALQAELKAARSKTIEVKQILATDLKRVDRCIICHVGYDSITNPPMVNEYKEHPYAAPKNEIHAKHPFEKYGCTTCHEGQGLATSFVSAGHMPKDEMQKSEWKKKHDWKVIEFWEHPMKAGPLIYASCSKCHEAHPKVAGVETVKKGKQLAFETGCVGCHQIKGEGNTIAPDLAEETSVKPLSRIDFAHAIEKGLISKDDRTLENWIRLHFTSDPRILTPGDPEGKLSPDPKKPQPVAPTAMPYFGFTKEESESLVAFVMSLKSEKDIPYTYRVTAPKEREPVFASNVQHGRYVFQKYGCTGCHGKNADKGIPIYNRQGERAPDLVKTIATFTREELIEKIKVGVNPEAKENESGPTPPAYMPSFKERIKGQELEDLVTYLFSVAEKTEDW